MSIASEAQAAPVKRLPSIAERPEVVETVESEELHVPVVKHGEQPYIEEQDRDFAGMDFDKAKPVMQLEGQDNPEFTHDKLQLAPPLKLKAFNHVALGVDDVDAIRRFYTKVLGFEEIPRPDLGFDGAWLYGMGFMIHVIQKDHNVPVKYRDWKDQYSEKPEAWYIRRDHHLAFEVEDFDETEHVLRQHGVEYSRHVLPDANVRQLFLYDPEGNGIEIGVYDNTRAFLKSEGCHIKL